MEMIAKQYIVNEQHETVAVQIDIHTFQKIEDIFENYALVQLMQNSAEEPALDLYDARQYYEQLEKAGGFTGQG